MFYHVLPLKDGDFPLRYVTNYQRDPALSTYAMCEMVGLVVNPTKMDDEMGYPHFRKPPDGLMASFV